MSVLKNRKLLRFSFLVLMGTAMATSLSFAQVRITGRVTDAITGKGVSAVTVRMLHTSIGAATDSAGYYAISTGVSTGTLQFTALGFRSVTKSLPEGSVVEVNVQLEQNINQLHEVEIGTKRPIPKHDRSAAELIRKVIGRKKQNRMLRFDAISFQTYEKLMIAFADIPRVLANSSLSKGYRFALENVDTVSVPGRALVPVYLGESFALHFKGRFPKINRTLVTAEQKTKLDERYVNNENLNTYFDFLNKEVDIYDNDILILGRPFLSPIAESALLFYNYYVTDTVDVNGAGFVEVTFLPRNDKDRLFSGKLHVSMDGNYAIGQADLSVDDKVNVNWLKSIRIFQRFGQQEGAYLPESCEITTVMSVGKEKGGVVGQLNVIYSDYDTKGDVPPELKYKAYMSYDAKKDTLSEAEWARRRPIPLSTAEANTYSNIDSLSSSPSFIRTLRLGYLATKGYWYQGPVEFGPFGRIVHHNQQEGTRIRLGGRITPELSDKYYLEGYMAYGFGDRQFKYYAGGAYTLNRREVGRYPSHYLQVSLQKEVNQPGEKLGFNHKDEFLRSFRRGNQDYWLYNTVFNLGHVVEFGNHWMLQTHYSAHKQRPAGNIHFFSAANTNDTLRAVKTSELGVLLRWAPYEEFFQQKLDRKYLTNKHPIFTFSYNMGIKGLLGGEYNYHALRFNVSKRFWLSQLGLADVNLGAGYIFGALPFPLLDIPTANQTYLTVPDAFDLMNSMEFVNDQFIKMTVRYRMLGFVFNKIPLLSRLKWRETSQLSVLYGGLRNENLPEYNPEVFRFPTYSNNVPATFEMGKKPYMEWSIGIENIFKLLRIEYVRRLSYLDHPNIDGSGIRFTIRSGF
ncbi:DUF5686 and carboxypeptidase-like regulatory domain-containing protein [Olivibacter sitiensis]|uniref:DUF5686 and carboxypeptidase-like regulatory domain-containing protein n=1 Tax=Olivibacter sitiensis TaxID=376470 RepID=UPI00040C1A4E|nr:DUF5686 and carboxypeptidase-like regulatory domain-containing protein [Olivibacter sitiensis]